MAEKEAKKMSTLELIQAAKDFSFEQKLKVVQSVVQMIPREQQKPWNLSQSSWDKFQLEQKPKSSATATTTTTIITDEVDGTAASSDKAHDLPLEKSKEEDFTVSKSEPLDLKQPPLLDPYEKSMHYYEKNMILNRFQVKHLF